MNRWTCPQQGSPRWNFSRPLKKCSSNATGTFVSKRRAVQMPLRSDSDAHFGLFAGNVVDSSAQLSQ